MDAVSNGHGYSSHIHGMLPEWNIVDGMNSSLSISELPSAHLAPVHACDATGSTICEGCILTYCSFNARAQVAAHH